MPTPPQVSAETAPPSTSSTSWSTSAAPAGPWTKPAHTGRRNEPNQRCSPLTAPSGATLPTGGRRQLNSAKAAGHDPSATPWLPDGVPASGMTLGAELIHFSSLVELTREEILDRQAACHALQPSFAKYWPSAIVAPYGSFAYGLSLPTSAVDIVVQHCSEGPELFQAALGDMVSSGWTVEGTFPGEDEWFARLRSPRGVVMYVSFIRGESRALQVVDAIKGLCQVYTAVRPVYDVVRTLLRQSKVLDPLTGGLSSYAVLLILLQLCRSGPPPTCAGQLFVDFVAWFSAEGPLCVADSADAAVQSPRTKAAAQSVDLWVTDPIEPSANVAAGCRKLHQIRALLRHCGMVLHRACSPLGPAVSLFKGKSGLAGIVALRDLWPRAAIVAASKSATGERLPQCRENPDKQSAEDSAQSSEAQEHDKER
eukprot:TRINITY_DN4268_c0_g1_i1.p1 TRINITY_DN4268_c0_g1~~TRINITY_DN4268_c0_g1_i1.p1  ORF type:complete len:425 (+),score=61.27 TRINITY_DN4268_c0_g1_i1:71-1345(+)